MRARDGEKIGFEARDDALPRLRLDGGAGGEAELRPEQIVRRQHLGGRDELGGALAWNDEPVFAVADELARGSVVEARDREAARERLSEDIAESFR